MLKTILAQLSQELEGCGVPQVYTAFDNFRLDKKGRGVITVVSVDSFESTTPIYSDSCIFLPFKGEAEISLIAAEGMTLQQLYNFFDEKVLPVAENGGRLRCSLKNLSVKRDSNICRLVMKVRLSVSGICRLERSL